MRVLLLESYLFYFFLLDAIKTQAARTNPFDHSKAHL